MLVYIGPGDSADGIGEHLLVGGGDSRAGHEAEKLASSRVHTILGGLLQDTHTGFDDVTAAGD